MTYWKIICCKLERVGGDSAHSRKMHAYVKRNSKAFQVSFALSVHAKKHQARQSTLTNFHPIKKKRRKGKGAVQFSLAAYSTVGNIFLQM